MRFHFESGMINQLYRISIIAPALFSWADWWWRTWSLSWSRQPRWLRSASRFRLWIGERRGQSGHDDENEQEDFEIHFLVSIGG